MKTHAAIAAQSNEILTTTSSPAADGQHLAVREPATVYPPVEPRMGSHYIHCTNALPIGPDSGHRTLQLDQCVLLPPMAIRTLSRLRSMSIALQLGEFAALLAMMESKAVIGEADMVQSMQQVALGAAGKALDLFDVTQSTEIAYFIKKEFDKAYGPGWQCIVGTDFGSFVTHHFGCFIYFAIGRLAILLFRGASAPEIDASPCMAMEPIKA